MIYLVTGGSGCGKSTWAEKLIDAQSSEMPRYYIATMQVYDEESVRRVARHRAQRADKGFTTIEQPQNLAAVQLPENSVVLLEDLPNLLANEMFDGGDQDGIVPALSALARRCHTLVMVTNDIFSDGVTYAPSTQDYLQKLAAINRHTAGMADTVAEVVYSIPIALKGELPCL